VFLESWSGKPLHTLYDVMRTTMPEDNPGSLSQQQYADLVAYLLELNGFPAGTSELAGTDESMNDVRVEPLKK
jgi:hypothetical protein